MADAIILQSHPLRESYNEALLARAIAGLQTAGMAHDLHRIGGTEDPDPGDFGAATALLLVHPTWWGGLPAPLLGWVQRRLGPWIDGSGLGSPSPLRRIDRLISVTTHGSAQWLNRVQGEPGRQLVARSVRPLCAPGATHDWIALYKLDRLSPSDLAAFLDRVEADVSRAVSP